MATPRRERIPLIRVREWGPRAWSDGRRSRRPGYSSGVLPSRRRTAARAACASGTRAASITAADDRQHDQPEHQQPQHRAGAAAVLGQRLQAEQLVDHVGDQPGEQRCGGRDQDRAHHLQARCSRPPGGFRLARNRI